MSKNSLNSRYQQIALDIAQRIVEKDFALGEKVHGRSVLSGMYNVSPETIRKAVALLQDMDVLMVQHGSGIMVNSVEKAYNFIQRFKYIDSISSLKHDLIKLSEEKRRIDERVEETLNNIVEYADKLKNLSPYNPVEVEVFENSPYIGCTISELKFWQNTGGTVVALRKGEDLIISPGPYAVLEKGNVIVVVGDIHILENVEKFINGENT